MNVQRHYLGKFVTQLKDRKDQPDDHEVAKLSLSGLSRDVRTPGCDGIDWASDDEITALIYSALQRSKNKAKFDECLAVARKLSEM